MPRLELQLTIPNQLTLLRILLTPVFVVMLLSDSSTMRQLSLVVFIIAALTDWYDGWIARKLGYVSQWGKFLDPLADKVLSSAALLAFVALGLVYAWMVWVIIIRDLFITFLRAYAEFRDRPVVTSRSAQAKTFSQFVVMYYILILYVGRTIPSVYAWGGTWIDALMQHDVLFGMMLLVTIMTAYTGVAYVIENRKTIRDIYEHFTATRP
jgi:CDP-diacylglycerol--glycerol-3-phosphate 3-phosphatidyltransferase